MNVALGEREIIKGHAVVPEAADPEFRLIIGTGHFHAHTERFSAWTTIDGVREPLFEDFDWHEPELFRFDSATIRDALRYRGAQERRPQRRHLLEAR